MFDFGFGELLLLGVIALVVLGPERLPVAARLLGRWIRAARNQWNAVKSELENELADDELRRNLREAADAMREGTRQLHEAHSGIADAAGQMARIATPALVAPAVVVPASAPVSVAPLSTDQEVPRREEAGADLRPTADPAQLSLLDSTPPTASIGDRQRDDG